jgi:hypothetical protein
MKPPQHILTVAETGELILAACTQEHGAIEDCEVSDTAVLTDDAFLADRRRWSGHQHGLRAAIERGARHHPLGRGG